LRRPQIACLVEDALLHFDGTRYRLLCWVVMPNHVHLLMETSDAHPLPKVVQSWKSFTAKQANAILGRTGTFWDRDYFDRFIRDDGHLAAVTRYIEDNPVKAGLVGRAEEWAWGSAQRRGMG
jgi:putative transposase